MTAWRRAEHIACWNGITASRPRAWNFQVMPKLANHDAGFFCLSRPVATEVIAMSARHYKTPRAYYCGVDLHARSLYIHICDPADTPRFEKRCRQRVNGPTP